MSEESAGSPEEKLREIDMNRRERSELRDRVVRLFDLGPSAGCKDACHRVGAVMSTLLDARVEVRFVSLGGTRLSGATMRLPDGGYVVYCAKSRFWYHRLGILLHELAHVVLGHRPVTLAEAGELHRFAPHLPAKMARLIAGRTTHTAVEEREAEALADEILERLTEHQDPGEADETRIAPHVLRIAEGLGGHRGGWRHRPDP